MFSHRQIWSAIDALATRYGLSPSGMAKLAGLDPTIFNKSKRQTTDGRGRWPNTESLAKILEATGASLDEFLSLVNAHNFVQSSDTKLIPLIGFAQAGGGGFFDDGGFPTGADWEEVDLPQLGDENIYALEIAGDSMLPVYRNGDRIIVSPNANVRRYDRVVVKTKDGEVMAKILQRQTASTLELTSFNAEHELREIAVSEVVWIARILWASQ